MLDATLHDAMLAAAAEPMAGGGLLVAAVLLVLVAFGVPLFVVIGGFAVACFLAWPEYANTFQSLDGFANNFNLIERMVELAEQPTMVAIPFFMIAGAIMSRGAIASRLVAFANALFGWLPGGLALSTIAACMFFAAISGSSPVTVITIGAIMLPALVKAGYGERLGLGLVTTAGTLGIIIPPSIPMIVYAIFATSTGQVVNIEDLFIAGIGPGLLIGLLLAGYCLIKGRGIERERFSIRRVMRTLLDGIWALFLPFFILGGIYLGVFNATEASAISVVLALGIELGIHRSLTLDELPGILAETAVLMGSILVIVCVAFGFSEFMAIKEVPDAIVHWLAGFELTPVSFIILLNLLLLAVGCLMDIISAIILFVPLVAPIAGQLGFDPIHVGLIFIVNLEIGYLTPPLGLNLFVATTYFGKPFGLVIRSVLPFLLLLVLSLGIVTWVPTVSLGIGNLRSDRPFWTPFPSGTVLRPIEEVDEELYLSPDAPLPDVDAPSDGGGGSVQDLMNDPEYRKLMEQMGAQPAGEEDVEDELPPDDELPPADEPDEGGAPIQDLMRDPEYRKLMESMGQDAP
ncbi:MAG: TRAP transporter large permease subunit [Deltaproteobacteria bacterium]|nr:TRAP transporter large permease subunit [Deltaproteobacteria bacterium]MCB9785994.1 TRAP transporter large permease subunit [Deltaproteobacteria bacterium]